MDKRVTCSKAALSNGRDGHLRLAFLAQRWLLTHIQEVRDALLDCADVMTMTGASRYDSMEGTYLARRWDTNGDRRPTSDLQTSTKESQCMTGLQANLRVSRRILTPKSDQCQVDSLFEIRRLDHPRTRMINRSGTLSHGKQPLEEMMMRGFQCRDRPV